MSTNEIYDILTSLGYQLQDRGNYWQTNALFRQGDNKTAIQIYKDTGVWRDFVNDTPPLRFETLVQKSVSDSKQLKDLFRNKNFSELTSTRSTSTPKLSMETIYPEDSLKKLLPHYRFYNDKGISSETLQRLKGGLATQGQLYQRFVFPIYNEDKKIHGFSGRDMLNKEGRPKWKHVGRKSSWVYPAYSALCSELENAESIIIVESIGDLLALHEKQIFNVLVSFGLDISPALISYLIQVNPSQIVFSFNNDFASSTNRGLEACFKNYFKLMSYFDHSKLCICLPLANDFGDMSCDSFEKWCNKLHNLDKETQKHSILKESLALVKNNKWSKKLIKNRNLLKQILDD